MGNNNFDIILVDYHMPELNGLKVIEKIREFDKRIKIIVLTIDERYEIANKFLENGIKKEEKLKHPFFIFNLNL